MKEVKRRHGNEASGSGRLKVKESRWRVDGTGRQRGVSELMGG